MNRMSCSMTTTARPLVADLEDQLLGLPGLLRVHAGGRLVEQEQLRVGGQRPGDLQPPLVAVGQVAGEVLGRAGQPDEVEQLLGPCPGRRLLARNFGPRMIEVNGPAVVRQ